MEKRKPHHDLQKFKKLFFTSATRVITKIAQKGAASMGYMDMEDIQKVLKRLGPDGQSRSGRGRLGLEVVGVESHDWSGVAGAGLREAQP